MLKRRTFLKHVCLASVSLSRAFPLQAAETNNSFSSQQFSVAPPLRGDWLAAWEKHIMAETQHRYCDHEMGEELGWLMSPFLNGFYYGYLATGEVKWVEQLVEWADSWIERGVKEPDGFIGWPKTGTGGAVEKELYTDSLLGEAMAFPPVVLIAGEILKRPELKERFETKAEGYLNLASKTFEKWIARGCWRDIREGGVWVVPEFGVDQKTGKWTEGYSNRNINGFTGQ
ncbi:MAG TPA: hypothetical protein VLT36_20515 [Candidatus Dormibacteraeota bacterium]|nr:hypothetical protein [Candidatus Dormibacteraeota bacterium]